jgi:hypothetical protein
VRTRLGRAVPAYHQRAEQQQNHRLGCARGWTGRPAYLTATRGLLGAAQAPTLVSGDVNSLRRRQARGAQWILGRQGYVDAYTAPRGVDPEV